MKKMLFVILLFADNCLFAQTIGGSFMLGSPQGEFRDNVDRLGYGVQVQGTIWSPDKKRPFALGLNLGYLVYGEESSLRPLSEYIPDVAVNVNRNNSLANFHLLFLLSPFTGTWRPYAEGLFGGSYIFTTTSVESQYSNENVFESTNFDDFTLSYGGGAGLLILLTKDLGDVKGLYLDLKVRYIYGGEAEYLKEGSITIQNGRAYYDVIKSKTDLMTFHIGVMAFF